MQSAARSTQLDDGLTFLRRELTKLADHYPDDAQRLRISAERLSAATGGRA